MALLPIRDLPAAGLQTSAADLGRFMQAMLIIRTADGQPFLRPANLKEILDPQNKDVELDLGFLEGENSAQMSQVLLITLGLGRHDSSV